MFFNFKNRKLSEFYIKSKIPISKNIYSYLKNYVKNFLNFKNNNVSIKEVGFRC